jgi:hypothetical protein
MIKRYCSKGVDEGGQPHVAAAKATETLKDIPHPAPSGIETDRARRKPIAAVRSEGS